MAIPFVSQALNDQSNIQDMYGMMNYGYQPQSPRPDAASGLSGRGSLLNNPEMGTGYINPVGNPVQADGQGRPTSPIFFGKATDRARSQRYFRDLRGEFDNLRQSARRQFGADDKSLKQRLKEINEEEREVIGAERTRINEEIRSNNPVMSRARTNNAVHDFMDPMREQFRRLQQINPRLARELYRDLGYRRLPTPGNLG